MTGYALDPSRVRDISPDVLDEQGNLRVMPAAYWATTTPDERLLFGHRHAAYGFPTVELVEHLKEIIAGRPAIEIGAGNGVLAAALGITGTDSFQQMQPKYRAVYDATGQPPIRYGENVAPFDAAQAVRRYRPDVVVACWVTHKYDRRRHWAGGNKVGVDEEALLERCQQYVFIGNEHVHKDKKLWAQPHEIEHPPFVFSRAANDSRDFIATWRGKRPSPRIPAEMRGAG